MGGQDDFAAALKAIMAARRRELGGPLTAEEVLAYRDGRLEPEEREKIAARLAVDPEAARALADLEAFPNIEPASGATELTDADIEAGWLTFREKLDKQPEQEDADAGEDPIGTAARTAPPVPMPRPPTVDRRRARERRPATKRWAAAAALLLAVGAGSFFAGRASRPLPDTAVNVDIVELAPIGVGGTRGKAPERTLAPHQEGLLLLLRGPADGTAFADYEVEIRDRQGSLVLGRKGLRPTELGNFHLEIRPSVLKPGAYRLVLAAREDGSRIEIAAYELQLLPGDPR